MNRFAPQEVRDKVVVPITNTRQNPWGMVRDVEDPTGAERAAHERPPPRTQLQARRDQREKEARGLRTAPNNRHLDPCVASRIEANRVRANHRLVKHRDMPRQTVTQPPPASPQLEQALLQLTKNQQLIQRQMQLALQSICDFTGLVSRLFAHVMSSDDNVQV